MQDIFFKYEPANSSDALGFILFLYKIGKIIYILKKKVDFEYSLLATYFFCYL
jgi:hypothetical protein